MRHPAALLALHDFIRRGRQTEARADAERFVSQRPFHRELLWLPVGRIRQIELRREHVEGRTDLTRHRDSKAT
jgi:hypothetical protein